MLAAEFALGTLDAAERRSATLLRASDPAFDRLVREWDARLSPLARHIPDVAPGESAWRRVAAGLDARLTEPSARIMADNVVALHRAVRTWRAATLMTGALAAGLALFAIDRNLLRTGPAPASGAYVAAVNQGGDMPALIVRVDLAAHAVTVRPVEAQTPPGKSLELWYVAAGHAPKSMGVVGKDRERMAMPAAMELQGGVFAVSVEPMGGSPTGAPTGPVIYKGMLVAE